MPDGGKVRDESEDALAFFFADGEAVGLVLALVFLLGLGERAQLPVPLRLQRIGHQPVGGIHLHVATAGVVSLVLGSLDLAVAQAIGLVEAGRYLLLNSEGHSSAIGVTASTNNLLTAASMSVPRMFWHEPSPSNRPRPAHM